MRGGGGVKKDFSESSFARCFGFELYKVLNKKNKNISRYTKTKHKRHTIHISVHRRQREKYGCSKFVAARKVGENN